MLIFTGTWLLILLGTVLGHWILPGRFRGLWIIAVTAGFLIWQSPSSFILLTALTAFVFLFAGSKDKITGWSAACQIAAIGILLAIFKIKVEFAHFGHALSVEDTLVPLGISYYTFRCIHYVIEKYKGKISSHKAAELVEYLFFLPTLIAGPIHRFPDFARDLKRKRFDAAMFGEGLERILFGYVKISFLANLLTNQMFGIVILDLEPNAPQLAAYLEFLQTGFNLYFQFAGFSDIAIGFGLLLGVRVMENFNWPLLKTNIAAFWRSWHISLSSWCRDYVYMGVISVSRSPAAGAVAAMVVMGLWHEFSLRYLIWGAYHGIGIMIWQKFQDFKPESLESGPAALRISWRIFSQILTLHFVFISFTFVRQDGILDALEKLIFILTGP